MYLLTDDYTCDTKVSGEVKAFQISRVVFVNTMFFFFEFRRK
jgi:hypothetical protein